MSKNARMKAEINRIWGDTPVVDAENDLRVIIQPCDVAKATPKDPSCCVFAQACKRAMGSKKVLFLRTVAYVELPNESGDIRVERFFLPPEMKSLIADFDKGKEVLPKAGFMMIAPKPSQKLDKMRAVTAKHRELAKKEKKEALIVGKSLKPKPKRNGGKTPKSAASSVDLEVRRGTGMVHFAGAKTHA
jgi:hypothetical protein